MTHRILYALSALSLVTVAACSSSSSSTTSTDAGKTTSHDSGKAKSDAGDGGSSAATPGLPPQPSGGATTSTSKHNLAVHRLYLGETDPTSAFPADGTAWKAFGYNLDGLDTTAASTDVCTPFTAGVTMQQVDGNNGIDNAFGSSIVPNLTTFMISSSELSGDIANGHFTLEIDTTGLSTAASQTNTGLSGAFFAGATYAGAPPLTGTSFSLSDNWPVSGSSLVDPTSVSGGARVTFPKAYVTGGTWVSGTATGPIPLNLILAGHTLTVNIHAGVVVMPITTDSSGQLHVTKGILAGVIDTKEFLTGVNPLLAETGFCQAQGLAETLIQGAQDILLGADGTVSNTAGTPCNAISLGLAFDADEIQEPSDVAPPVDAGPPGSCDAAAASSSGSGSSGGSASSSGSGSGSSGAASSSGSASSSGAASSSSG